MSRIASWTVSVWRRSMLHRALLVAPPVTLLLLAGFWTIGNRQGTQYYTAKVEKGDIVQVVQATGTINAVTSVQVGSQVSGNIARLLVDFNSHVQKDQVIAQIDPSTFRARLMQAEADLENAVANVKALEAQIEIQRADVLASKAAVDKAKAQTSDSRLNLERTLELFKQGIVSTAQRDSAQSGYDGAAAAERVTMAQQEQSQARLKSIVAQLEQGKAQVAQRRAAAEMARLDLDHTTIRAPIDGTVIARNVDVGQTVAASLQAPTLFIIAQDLTKMRVYAKTDESDVGKIKVGAVATFRVDSFPRETFRGRVDQVRMNSTTIQNVVTYDTVIEFDNPDQKLFPGMTAYVTVPVAWENDVVKVPNGALRFRPEMPEEERKALFARYNIPDEPRAGTAGHLAALGATPSGDTSRGSTSGMRRSPQASETAAKEQTEGPPRGSVGEDWSVIWKLLPNKSVQPVRIKLGVTDFTFTAMAEGSLRPGDELVIGQSSKGSSAQQPGGSQQRSPMGGPGGLPRRM